MKFSEQVVAHMQAQCIKPAQLARMIGYSAPYVADLISGDRRWNETLMQKTCAALGLEMTIQKAGKQHEEEG